jgi:hypothetical protein
MDYDAYKKKVRWFWFFALSVIWMWWIISMANNAYDKAAAQTATKTGFSHFWSSGGGIMNSDADNARMGIIMGGVFGLVLVFIVAHIIAGVQVPKVKNRCVARMKIIRTPSMPPLFRMSRYEIYPQPTDA